MDCKHCPATEEPVLYRCVECYQDGISECDMCDECKREHIDANVGILDINGKEYVLKWEILFP